MTGFDHLRTGTSELEWTQSGELDHLAPLAPPTRGDSVLVLAAHPDDETLGAGGLITACARASVPVLVVVASDGDASHPRSPTTTPVELAQRRRAEVAAAVALLHPSAEVQFLGLPDGGLSEHRAELTALLAPRARTATHLVSPWRSDQHPDHEVCAHVAAELAGMSDAVHWQYPIWAWHWDNPDAPALSLPALRRLDLGAPERLTKRRALDCHRSQHTALSPAPGDEAILPPEILAHFLREFETFVVDDAPRPSSPQFFDDLYARTADPWDLQGRFYESRKRDLVMAALPRRRFHRAFEPGCSIGLLTELLAQRCDEVIAWDVSARALEQAALRTQALPGVHLDRLPIPDEWPDGPLDLIVLSEVGYYALDLDQLAERVMTSLSADGVLLACHWRHEAPDHPQTAEAVHAAVGARLTAVAAHTEKDFLLEVWSRSGRSVAEDEGIVS